MTKVIRTALVYILVLIMCLGCVSIGSFAVLGEAFGMTAAAMGAMGYAGVGAVTDIAIGDLDNISSDMGIPIGQSNYKYNQSSGSVTYDTSVLNAILNKLALDFSGASSFKPSALNSSGAFSFEWTINNASTPAWFDGFGYSDGRLSDISLVRDVRARDQVCYVLSRKIPLSEISGFNGGVLRNDINTVTLTNPRAYVSPSSGNYTPRLTVYCFRENDTTSYTSLNFNAGDTISLPSEVVAVRLQFPIQVFNTNSSAITVPIQNAQFLANPVLGDVFVGGAVSSFELSVPSGHNWQDYLIPEDETAPTSTAVTFYDRNGENILVGLPPAQASQRLQEAFLNNEIAGTEISLGDGTVAAPDDDGDGLLGLIGAEVAWIRRLIQQLLSQFPIWLNGVKEAVVEAIESIKSHFNPDTFEPPLGFIPSGGFGFAGIWHYVVEWVGSLGAGLGFLASVWAGLPYAMVVPIYASAVVVIVVALFKRYIH